MHVYPAKGGCLLTGWNEVIYLRDLVFGDARGRDRDPLTAVGRLLLMIHPRSIKQKFSPSSCYEHDGKSVTRSSAESNRGHRSHPRALAADQGSVYRCSGEKLLR